MMMDYEFSHWDGNRGIGKVFVSSLKLAMRQPIIDSEFPLEGVTDKQMSSFQDGYYYWGPIKRCFVDSEK